MKTTQIRPIIENFPSDYTEQLLEKIPEITRKATLLQRYSPNTSPEELINTAINSINREIHFQVIYTYYKFLMESQGILAKPPRYFRQGNLMASPQQNIEAIIQKGIQIGSHIMTSHGTSLTVKKILCDGKLQCGGTNCVSPINVTVIQKEPSS